MAITNFSKAKRKLCVNDECQWISTTLKHNCPTCGSLLRDAKNQSGFKVMVKGQIRDSYGEITYTAPGWENKKVGIYANDPWPWEGKGK